MNPIPTKTFYHLPNEKKERIIEAAIEEFSQYYFQEAKISRIVKKAQIPRGSFYQYFSGKMDLYTFLFDHIARKKGGYMDTVLKRIDEVTSTKILREMFLGGIQFAHDHPLLAMIGSRFYREPKEFRESILGRYEGAREEFLKELLNQGQKRGEIKEEVDIKMVSFILSHMLEAMVDYVCSESEDENVFQEDGHLLEMLESLLYIFEYGIYVD